MADWGDFIINTGVDSSDLEAGLDRAVETVKADAQKVADALAILGPDLDETAGRIEKTFDRAADSIRGLVIGAQGAAQGTKAAGDEMASGFDAASKAGEQYSAMAQFIITEQDAVNHGLDAASKALDEIRAAYDRGQVGPQTLARAEAEFAKALDRAGLSTKNLKNEVQDLGATQEKAATGAASMAKELLALAGIGVGIAALKNYLVEAIETFAQLERARESLTALTKDAAAVEGIFVRLEALAKTDALSFPTLIKAAQQMTAFGVSLATIPGLLDTAANASRATGKSFDATVSSIERMVETGNASGKVLMGLGLTSKDLATVMGVTTGEVAKMFKALDQSARIDVVTEALQKYAGLAKATAGDLTGQWQNLKNTAEREFAAIGEQLAPLAGQFTAFASETTKELGSMVQGILSVGKAAKDIGPDVSGGMEAMIVSLIAARSSALALGVELIHLGLVWRGLEDAESDADEATKKATRNFDAMVIAQRQHFAEYPDFLAKLDAYIAEMGHGAISQDQFQLKVRELNAEFQKTHPLLVAAADAHKSFTQSVADLKAKLDAGTITQAQFTKSVHDLVAGMGNLNEKTKAHILTLGELQEKNQQYYADMKTAAATLEQAIALDDGSAKAKLLVSEAIKQYNAEMKKLGATITDTNILSIEEIKKYEDKVAKLKALNPLLADLTEKYGAMSPVTQQVRGEIDSLEQSMHLIPGDLDLIAAGMAPLGPAFHQVGVTAGASLDETKTKLAAAYEQIRAMFGALSGPAVAAWAKYQEAVKNAADASDTFQVAAHQYGITTVADLQAQKDQIDGLIQKLQALGPTGTGAWQTIIELQKKSRDLNDQIKAQLDPLADAYKKLGIQSEDNLRKDVAEKQQALATVSAYGKNTEAAQKAVEEAQKRLNEALGITDTKFRSIGGSAEQAGGKIRTGFDQGTSAVEKLLASLRKTEDALNGIEKQMLATASNWDAFQKNLNIGGGLGGSGDSFSASNPYAGLKSPDEMQQAFNQLISSFGGQIYQSNTTTSAFYAAQKHLLDWAIGNWYTLNPQTGRAPSVTPTITTTAAAPQVAPLAPDVKAFLDMLEKLPTSSFVNIGGALERVGDLIGKITALRTLPAEVHLDQLKDAVDSLNDLSRAIDGVQASAKGSIQGLESVAAGVASSIPALSSNLSDLGATVTRASLSVSAAALDSAAKAALIDNLGVSPSVGPGGALPTLASFQRLTGTIGGIMPSAPVVVNGGINVTSADNDKIAQDIVTSLQRVIGR